MLANINDVQMHWQEAGSGEPLVLIHGFPFDARMWQQQLAHPKDGWRYIAPDLRGFGHTQLGNARELSMDVFADDVVALLDHLGIDQAVIAGLSMGGYVALSLAMRHPDRVRALVLVATRAGADNEEARTNRNALAAKTRAEGSRAAADAMLPKLVSAHTRMKYPQVVEGIEALALAQPPEAVALALEGMAGRTDYRDDLAKVDFSTLVIRGEQDEIIAAADMEQIARTVRGARHEMIALSGHLPPLEAPDVFNKILGQFLGQLPPALKLGDFSLSF